MSKLDDYQFVINGTYLSDLFFNHDLSNYAALRDKEGGSTEEEIKVALLADAQDFADCLPGSQIDGPRVDFHSALVEEFLRRL